MATEIRFPVGAAAVLALVAILAGAAPTAQAASHTRHIRIPILMYHRIDRLEAGLPAITRRLTVDPGDFERQMLWLKRHGFHTITQAQLLAALDDRRPLPAKPVLLTFDDGYRDVLGKASPVIARLGMHATAYVITGRLSGADPSFLTRPQLRSLERRGIEIGSHTVTHAALVDTGDAEALEELADSRRTLERALGHQVPWLAYPYGSYDSRVAALAARAGYVLAVTTDAGKCQDATRPLELKRLEVLDTTGVAGLAALLAGAC